MERADYVLPIEGLVKIAKTYKYSMTHYVSQGHWVIAKPGFKDIIIKSDDLINMPAIKFIATLDVNE